MATANTSPSAGSEDTTKIDILKGSLYEACQQHGDENRVYTQKDLMDLHILPNNNDLATLMRLVQKLCDERLLISVNDTRVGLAWKWRSVEDAKKYKLLATEEQRMLYGMIDDAGADGIWARTLKTRLGMHDSVFKTSMKALESRGYVAQMKSVEHLNKKMWIKANLRPSDRATGGPWYTDSNLDEDFITGLEMFIFDYITQQSAYRGSVHHQGGSRQPKKGIVKGSAPGHTGGGGGGSSRDAGEQPTSASRSRKRAADAISDDAGALTTTTAGHTTSGTSRSHHPHHKKEVLLPMPAGYTLYPTVREIAELIDKSQITNNTTLSEADVQQLVDVLVYDGLIEPIKVGTRRGYRTTRIAKQDPKPITKRQQEKRDRGGGEDDEDDDYFPSLGAELPSNGYVEAPCGRCPVFELCEEGGPVNPSNCVYFQRWLGRE